MRELYIYYRVEGVQAAAACRAVEAMQAQLRRDYPALVARLLTRAGDGSVPQTWMETYALPGSTGGVDSDLEATIEAEAATWAHLVSGPRHLEAFVAAGDD